MNVLRCLSARAALHSRCNLFDLINTIHATKEHWKFDGFLYPPFLYDFFHPANIYLYFFKKNKKLRPDSSAVLHMSLSKGTNGFKIKNSS